MERNRKKLMKKNLFKMNQKYQSKKFRRQNHVEKDSEVE